jgi:hypothetical protein
MAARSQRLDAIDQKNQNGCKTREYNPNQYGFCCDEQETPRAVHALARSLITRDKCSTRETYRRECSRFATVRMRL